MITRIIKLFLSLCMIAGPAISQQSIKFMQDTSAFKQRISEKARITSTIESDFIQEKNLSVLSEKISTKGHFTFKKENMLRWEYLDPFEYVIVINKDKIQIRNEEKTSRYDMNSNKLFRSINDMMISSVQGTLLSTKDYSIRYLEDSRFYIVEMTPVQKGARSFLKTISLFFDKKEYTVSRVMMMEPSGDFTSIDFINQKRNEPVADSKFTLP